MTRSFPESLFTYLKLKVGMSAGRGNRPWSEFTETSQSYGRQMLTLVGCLPGPSQAAYARLNLGHGSEHSSKPGDESVELLWTQRKRA